MVHVRAQLRVVGVIGGEGDVEGGGEEDRAGRGEEVEDAIGVGTVYVCVKEGESSMMGLVTSINCFIVGI